MPVPFSLPFWGAGIVSGASSLYLAALTASAALQARLGSTSSQVPSATRFAVLIPAHNEELLITRTLQSLYRMEYPRELFDVYVIADNCDDGTASLARSAGAEVLERHDQTLLGKGFALDWALGRIPLERYHAVALVDADTVVDPGFLRAMNPRILAGAHALQGYYTVLQPESAASSLRLISFALIHYVRPLGKRPFGGSCGLKGNGMVFSKRLLEDVGWHSFSVVEDAEQHMRLVNAGYFVEFVPEARVMGEMPDSLIGARTQNLRWEAGRWMVARKWSLPLLLRGVKLRSLAVMDAAFEPMVPPLSVIAALAALSGAAGLAFGSSALVLLALGSLAGLFVHVLGGMLVAGVPFSAWRSLPAAPLYLLWKVALYAQALFGVGAQKWVRTPRATPEE